MLSRINCGGTRRPSKFTYVRPYFKPTISARPCLNQPWQFNSRLITYKQFFMSAILSIFSVHRRISVCLGLFAFRLVVSSQPWVLLQPSGLSPLALRCSSSSGIGSSGPQPSSPISLCWQFGRLCLVVWWFRSRFLTRRADPRGAEPWLLGVARSVRAYTPICQRQSPSFQPTKVHFFDPVQSR